MGSLCSTGFGFNEDDVFDEYEEAMKVSEKILRCSECGHPIEKGESYRECVGQRYAYDEDDEIDENESETEYFNRCQRCIDLIDSLSIFSCYEGDRILGEALIGSEEYIRECMVPNLPRDKKYLAIPYYKKLIRAKKGRGK